MRKTGAPFAEADCLACDPFDGDIGEPGDVTLRDTMATARTPGPCHGCSKRIERGERVRARADISHGELLSYRWCNACCGEMAAFWRCAEEKEWLDRCAGGERAKQKEIDDD